MKHDYNDDARAALNPKVRTFLLAPALVAAVFLSCKGPASPTSPLDTFARAASKNVERVTAPAEDDERVSVLPEYEKTISISAVRVTNTSGGTVLVGGPPPGKPVIVHVDVIHEHYTPASSDIEGLKEVGGLLGLYLWFDGAPVRTSHAAVSGPATIQGTGAGSEVYFTADMLAASEPAAVWLTADFSNGQWREVEMFYSAWLTAGDVDEYTPLEGWTLNDNPAVKNAPKYALDVVVPYPSDVVFHPVVTDSAQIPTVTQEIEDAYLYGDGFGIMDSLYVYTPLVIGEHRIGPPVVVDTLEVNAIGPNYAAFFAMRESYRNGDFDWDRSHKDFRVAVSTTAWPATESTVFEHTKFRSGGLGSVGFPFSAITYSTTRTRPPTWNLLHEMGHNLGLLHLLDELHRPYERDQNYPAYPDQNINVDGYMLDADGRVETLEREDHFDFMGWCCPEGGEIWISAYHYRRMAEYAFGIEPTLEARRPVVVR